MSRSKDDFIRRTGGFRFGESPEDFQIRLAEIDELEGKIKSGQIAFTDMERVQRRLCDLKGISFDFDDDDVE